MKKCGGATSRTPLRWAELAFSEDPASPLYGKQRATRFLSRLYADSENLDHIVAYLPRALPAPMAGGKQEKRPQRRRCTTAAEDGMHLELIHALDWPDAREDVIALRVSSFERFGIAFGCDPETCAEPDDDFLLQFHAETLSLGHYVVRVLANDPETAARRTRAALAYVSALRIRLYEAGDFVPRLIVAPDDARGSRAEQVYHYSDLLEATAAARRKSLLQKESLEKKARGMAHALATRRASLRRAARALGALGKADPPAGEFFVHAVDASSDAALAIPSALASGDTIASAAQQQQHARSISSQLETEDNDAFVAYGRFAKPGRETAARGHGGGARPPGTRLTAYEAFWGERMSSFSPEDTHRQRTAQVSLELASSSRRIASSLATATARDRNADTPVPHDLPV